MTRSLLTLSAIAPLLLAATAYAGKPVGASFLNMEASPANASLGAAGSAMVNGASSLFLNPGGLGATRLTELSASHAQMSDGDSFDSVAVVRPVFGFGWTPTGSWGAGVVSLRRGEIEARGADGASAGSFGSGDTAAFLSYGRRIGNGGVGVTVKALHQKIADETASGYAIDLGAQAKTPVRNLSLGLAILNLGPSMSFISESFSLPTRAQVGLSYRMGSIALLADGSVPVNESGTRLSFGVAATPMSAVVLRAGYRVENRTTGSVDEDRKTINGIEGLAAGLGIKMGRYAIDYALVPNGALDMSHQIGFSASFD